MNSSDINYVDILYQLNRAELERSSALILFLCLIALTGIPGNILVCVVYRNSYTTSMSRYFIFWLAVNDTINSCITVLELISVSYPYTYPSEWLCKFTIFLEMWPTLTSGILLAVISIDRYRKVCRPHRWQIRKRHAWIICIAITIFALLCSWPTFIFFGLREVALTPFNVTGHACLYRKKYDGTVERKVYGVVLWFIFLSVLVLLILLYSLIGKRIVYQIKKNDILKNRGSQKSIVVTKETSMTPTNDPSPNTSSSKYEFSRTESTKTRHSSGIGSESNRQSVRTMRAKRSAFVMFLISLVFVASFVPYLSLRLKESLDKTFIISMTDEGRAAYNFFLRLYFLNCAINPFIYGACNVQFRNGVRDLFRKLA